MNATTKQIAKALGITGRTSGGLDKVAMKIECHPGTLDEKCGEGTAYELSNTLRALNFWMTTCRSTPEFDRYIDGLTAYKALDLISVAATKAPGGSVNARVSALVECQKAA